MRRWHWLSGVAAALAVYGVLHIVAVASNDALAVWCAVAVIVLVVIVKILDRPQK